MLKQILVASSMVLIAFAGQTALAGPVLNIDPDLMGIPRGGIIVDQQPRLTGGSASDTLFLDDLEVEAWQLLADNVMLSLPGAVRQIRWWGFYGGSFSGSDQPPAGDEEFRIRFYLPRQFDGLPDDAQILYEESILNPNRLATGRFLFGSSPEFAYETSLASTVNLLANTLYWFEIAQSGDVDSHFRWETGAGLQSGFAFKNSNLPDWQAGPGSYAFQLSSVPEPSSLCLFVASVLFLKRSSWGRRRRCP